MAFSIKFDKDFWRRFKFYGFGLVFGMILVSIITKGKACQLPSTVKMEELRSQTIEYSTKAECYINCNGITKENIKHILQTSVNEGKRDVFAEGYPEYTVSGKILNNHAITFIIRDSLEVSKIMSVKDNVIEPDTVCVCK